MTPHRMRVLMASTVHRWNDVRIYYKEALSLATVADIHLVAVQDPDQGEVPNGVITVELLSSRGRRQGKGSSVLLRFRRLGQVLNIVLRRKYDVFHFHDPELIPVGWFAKLRGKKVVYDMHEDAFTMLLARTWLSRPLAWLMGFALRAIERVSLLIFDIFILAAKSLAPSFKSSKCRLVLNYPIFNHVPPPNRRKDSEALKLVYAGALTMARGAADMLEAVSALRRAGKNVTLDLFGMTSESGLDERIKLACEDSWVTYHGWLPMTQLLRELPDYHVGLSPVHDYPNYRHALLTKVLDYLAAGLPIVASRLPGTTEILAGAECAVFYQTGNVSELQAAISVLLDEEKRFSLANNGRKVIYQYRWESQAEELINIYREVLN